MSTTKKKTIDDLSVLEQQLLAEPVPVGAARLYHRVWLHAMYVDAHMTVESIGNKLGVQPFEVTQALRLAGIKLRPKTGRVVQFPQLRDPVFMVKHLATLGMSIAAVARLVGCGDTTIRQALEFQDVKEALAAAGWSRSSRPAPVRSGRVSRYDLPDDERLLVLLAGLAGESGWVSNGQLVAAAGLQKANESTIRDRLRRLCSDDRVVVRRTGSRVTYRPAAS